MSSSTSLTTRSWFGCARLAPDDLDEVLERGEGARLDAPAPADGGGEEAGQRARVRLHRAADVAQQHDAARARGRAEIRALHRFAAGPERATDRPAHVGAAAVAEGRAQPARPPQGS